MQSANGVQAVSFTTATRRFKKKLLLKY